MDSVPFLFGTLAGGKSFPLSSKADGILEHQTVSWYHSPVSSAMASVVDSIKYEGISMEA